MDFRVYLGDLGDSGLLGEVQEELEMECTSRPLSNWPQVYVAPVFSWIPLKYSSWESGLFLVQSQFLCDICPAVPPRYYNTRLRPVDQ